jgi:histidinol dehydrogenase
MIEIVRTADPGFPALLTKITSRGEVIPPEVEETVRAIIDDVRKRGDRALVDQTERLDGVRLTRERIEILPDEVKEAAARLAAAERETILAAADRINAYHRRQTIEPFTFLDEHGDRLGQIVRPLARVGIYVPGGTAPYPSTLLMNAIPARVAGVREIVAVHPAPGDRPNPAVMAAAEIAGVDRLFRVGGAQAIAALAFGTETIPKVDKIVGPGNVYVATAKRMLFGVVDIDMIAGPSEILIVADQTADPAFIAADLLSQAEHDERSGAILVATDEGLATKVIEELGRRLSTLPRKEIAARSLRGNGAVVVAGDIEEAIEIANLIAPEHLELMVKEPVKLVSKVENAGAVFLGAMSPEAVGDYAAGPSHVLPTGGTARFSSPLSVYDFMKRISIIEMSEAGLREVGKTAAEFAAIEGLSAHERAVRMRFDKK